MTKSTAGTPSVAGPAAGQGRQLGNSWIALLLVILLSAGLVALHIHSYRQLSQYDEAQHVDYIYYLLRGEIPKSGDRWLPPTTEAVACRNIDSPWPYPPCDSSAHNGQMPNYGLTTEFIQTPLYYIGVAASALALGNLLPQIDEISAMRMTNGLWLAAGLILLWVLWRDLRVPPLVRAGLSIGLIASPILLLTQSTVTNDGTALAAGAAVLLTTLRWEAGRCRMWVPLSVAFVALMLKTTNLAVVLVACAFILVRSLQQAEGVRQRWRSLFTTHNVVFVAGCAVATIVVGLGWSALQGSRETLDPLGIPQNMIMVKDQFDPSWLASGLIAVIAPLEPEWLQAAMAGVTGSSVAYVTSFALLGLAVLGAVRSEAGSVVRALSIATGLAALTFGPLLTLVTYASLHIWFPIPARYGISLVPAMAVIAGTAVRSRRWQIALLAVALVLYAADAARLLLR
jgi:hypothetical protein